MSHAEMSEVLRELWEMLSVMDLIIIGVILVSAAIGFSTGFVWQVARIVGLVASIWLSWLYHPIVADSLSPSVGRGARLVIGALIVFLAALIVFYLIAFLFRNVINALKPEMPDRLLGAGFGIIKAGLLIGIAAFLVMHYLSPGHPIRSRVEKSRGAVAAATCVRAFIYVLPDRLVVLPEQQTTDSSKESSLQEAVNSAARRELKRRRSREDEGSSSSICTFDSSMVVV